MTRGKNVTHSHYRFAARARFFSLAPPAWSFINGSTVLSVRYCYWRGDTQTGVDGGGGRNRAHAKSQSRNERNPVQVWTLWIAQSSNVYLRYGAEIHDLDVSM